MHCKPHVCKLQEEPEQNSSQRNPSHKLPFEFEAAEPSLLREDAPTSNSPTE